ncbi:alpha/beta fold hydrolase [Cognatishimia activa]|uniref:3-oxoadipate enol-lactonase 2 n=1 Tax=Cognatishimia activa TaxID=1715691 RepID=A0A0P1ISG5_9RHOB|nr:alpha/beta fold hydrolase [Cognatishimia activa]CUI70060.1 3-oxoadipate enol-lactonase 2 [Cognatishimia activa]CUK26554.1 3-oxoadipate enol-lactonase 2 [Cognatishimia activa]
MDFTAASFATNTIQSGPEDGAPLVLLHSLGGDLSTWDPVLPQLPETLRIVRINLRGHGKTECPPPPYSMGSMIREVEQSLDNQNIRDAVVVGIGLGGLVAQGLAVKRLDQVRALVLVNTAAKLGHPPHWQAMIDEINGGGKSDLAKRLMPLWFHRAALKDGLEGPALDVFEQTNSEGLAGALDAIKGTDFYTPTAGLRLPCLGIAGAEDRFVPNDMTRETTSLIPGSDFVLLRKSGHLPPQDQPEAFALHLTEFLVRIGHASSAPT